MGRALNVLFVSSDAAGCRHYRMLLPARELYRQGGHTVLVAGEIVTRASGEIGAPSAEDVRRAAFGFDIVVMQRWMNEEAPDVIRKARACGQVVINDVDDWFFGIPTSNVAFDATHKRSDARSNVEHYRKVLAASSALTVSTPYLAKRLESLGRPVHVLRNAIDLDRYEPRSVVAGSLIVGWHGHLAHGRTSDLGVLGRVLGPFMKRHEHARFLHIGSEGEDDATRMADVLGIERDRLLTRPLFHISQMHHKLGGIDIGIAPLDDSPFSLAKSWVKPLEYAAVGHPAVCSDRPEYRAFGPVALCRTPKDWTEAFERLADPDERTKAAVVARARARELDIALRWREWERAYMKIQTQDATERLSEPPPLRPTSIRFPSAKGSARSTARASRRR